MELVDGIYAEEEECAESIQLAFVRLSFLASSTTTKAPVTYLASFLVRSQNPLHLKKCIVETKIICQAHLLPFFVVVRSFVRSFSPSAASTRRRSADRPTSRPTDQSTDQPTDRPKQQST